MKYDELVEKIQKFYGLKLSLVARYTNRVEIEVLSPTEKRLFTITLFQSEPDNWEWSGCKWNTEVPYLELLHPEPL